LLALLGALTPHSSVGQLQIQCYDSQGRAQRCMPQFGNAAFGKRVISNNTCGDPPKKFCVQTGVLEVRKECEMCNSSDPALEHPALKITDIKDDTNRTWWQSETLLENPDKPVTLTLDLGKSYDVSYIRIRFRSPRPESMAIYKKTTPSSKWIPYQYFSATCEKTYGVTTNGIVDPRNQQVALCTDAFSTITPLTGGNVAFSTLEDRPDAYNFDNSPALQEWVTAVAVRIHLRRMNTFGDEVFGDPNVLRSYYYAIIDLSIGGRCKCNGHASECEETRLWDGQTRLQCKCQHDTEGVDCERCKPLYNDRPWARASSRNANECVRCNCNGLAESCVFDEALYRQTGHGGRCQNCKQNTDGPNCERCKENFYRKTSLEPCVACGCNPVGSVSLQCNSEGQCRCKPGVTGIKCDKCQANYFGFSQTGCRPCQCFGPGTDPAKTQCNEKGECTCKRHVVGAKCTLCRSGYFGLEASNPHGCKQCFCYGHSTVCKAAPGYTSRNITTDFTTGLEGWAVENDQGDSAGFVSVTAIGKESLFARASLVYIGNRRSSYGQTFGFMFRVGTVDGMQVDNGDITIEGEGGLKITTQLTAQGNPKPGVAFQQYRYRLHEDASFGWRPSLTSHDFQRLLTSIKSIKIRMNYADQGTGMLDGMFFESAVYDPTSPNQVNWVEQCSCPKEYKGNNCEQCKDGYTRQAGSTDRYAQCVPCQCYGHSDTCDPVTGKCNCKHNTTGIRCDKCIDGYYGNPTQGTPDDCKKCPCKFGTRCIQIGANVVCTDCPEGHVGNLCDMCQDGYYGDPMGKRGAPTTCQKCNCSGNIDPNAIGSCDRLTGDCLKCIHNTRNGPISQCELCAIGYYGNATHYPKPQCKACECYVQGTVSPPGHDPTLPFPCDDKGRCTCLPNVSGDKCDTCRPEYWNVASGKGCEPCNCDTTGSWNNTCSVTTGQCHCKPGVTGRRCDQCSIDHYAFSELGCLACNCNLQGSLNVTCDEQGVCQCRPGVLGIKCDSCQENFHNLTAGCIACPPCYDVIQKIVGGLRRKLYDLIYIIDRFNTSSSVVVDVDFEKRLALLKEQVERLLGQSRRSQQYRQSLNDRVTATRNKVIEIWKNTQAAGNASRAGMSDAMMAHDSLNVSRHLLDLMKSLLMSDAARSLNESRLFANSTGEWRMREIAEETKKLADKHENQADEITQKAVQAANASEQAVKTVDKAVEAQNQTSIDLAELRRMLGEVEQLHVTTRANASKARDRAQNAMRDADELYKNGTAPLPDLGIDAIRAKANETKAKASEKAMEAMKILSDLKGLVTSFDAKEADVRKKMAEWPGLMDQLEKLLAAIDNANATAWDAFIKGEDTLQKAKEMLETMQKFNEIIENSRKEAEKAEQNIPEIERLIASANAKSDNATASLGDAQQVAGEAKDKAGQAQKTADAARMKAEKIRIEAQNLTLPTDTVSTPAKRAADKLQELKDRVGRERDAIAAAKEKSTNATAASKRARDKIDEVLRKLNELLKEIDNLDMVDMNKLDELEKKLDNEIESERKVDGALANVEDTHRIIRERITEYTVDLERLKKQMAQVQNVINSMPDTCKKRITKSEGRG
ncbi:predicted protein, partial [Nematostella vectensis]